MYVKAQQAMPRHVDMDVSKWFGCLVGWSESTLGGPTVVSRIQVLEIRNIWKYDKYFIMTLIACFDANNLQGIALEQPAIYPWRCHNNHRSNHDEIMTSHPSIWATEFIARVVQRCGCPSVDFMVAGARKLVDSRWL